MKKILVLSAVAVLFAAGCDSYNDERGRGDSPVGDRIEEPRTVIFNVDKFPNLSVICDGATAIYTNSREAGTMVAVPNSEHCRDGAR